MLPALTFLDTCLRDVLALIIKRGKKRTSVQLPVDALMGKSSKVRALPRVSRLLVMLLIVLSQNQTVLCTRYP